MLSCEFVQKSVLTLNFAEAPVNLAQLLEMVSCSKFYSTTEVLAAVLRSDDEDLHVKNIGFMGPFC